MTAPRADNGRRTTDCRGLHPESCALRPAFTLVEMLVVITIIGILASLATVAAYKALEAAKRARITAEIANLDGAVKAYKEKYGDYPPCFYESGNATSTTAVQRHLSKAFPRCNVANELAVIPDHLTPGQSLVFWLTSVSNNAQQPLSANVDSSGRQSFFDFDKSRLTTTGAGTGGWTSNTAPTPPSWSAQIYHPPGLAAPYAYFEARGYLDNTVTTAPFQPIKYTGATLGGGSGTCMPFLWDTDGDGKFDDWCNPKSFQIISAGLDDNYGADLGASTIDPGAGNPITANNSAITSMKGKMYPTGTGYDSSGTDDDNLTDFSDKQLGDAKP